MADEVIILNKHISVNTENYQEFHKYQIFVCAMYLWFII